MRITVFTPTYNRGYIIENLYRSLQQQSFHDFEWIVIDDGSEDNTEELINKMKKKENGFFITYIKQDNGGKHRAINRGVSLANGELFFIVDSDDYLTADSLEYIDKMERTIPADKKVEFAGICGLRGYSCEKINGRTFKGEILDIISLDRPQYGIYGDKAEVFYTDILKRYPFPEYDGENFITECVVWDKIAADGYKLRYFNKIVYICDYLPDGLTAHEKELKVKNPKGDGLYLYQSAQYKKITGLGKWNQFLQYYYMHRNNMKFKDIAGNLHINPVILYLRLLGMRIFYKLYDR